MRTGKWPYCVLDCRRGRSLTDNDSWWLPVNTGKSKHSESHISSECSGRCGTEDFRSGLTDHDLVADFSFFLWVQGDMSGVAGVNEL